jgi:predicted RNA-binding Zn-ribbon protein involved in translation (DUF1610 family)
LRDIDVHMWFAEDELQTCPSCGEQAGVRLPQSGAFLCLGCGEITLPSNEPKAQEGKPYRRTP